MEKFFESESKRADLLINYVIESLEPVKKILIFENMTQIDEFIK
jgi:hypothetical protein